MAQLFKNVQDRQKFVWDSLLQAKHNHKLSHALLFSGEEGLKQKDLAWAWAQVLICKKTELACGKCVDCLRAANKQSEHILFIEPEPLVIKVQAVRDILRFVSLQSFSPARFIIIDSAHKMNPQAVGSLLKILEEPPPKVYFILISPDLSALPDTIRSRLQILRFSSLKNSSGEGVEVQETAGFEEKEGLEDEKEAQQELREQAFNLLEKALSLSELAGFYELSDLVKNREQALFVCLCWQKMVRSARCNKIKKESLVHSGRQKCPARLSRLPAGALDHLFMNCVRAERDIKQYIDSVLVFDHLFISAREQAKRFFVQ